MAEFVVGGFAGAEAVVCCAKAYSSRLITRGVVNVTAADRFKKDRRLDLAFISNRRSTQLRPFPSWILIQ